MTEEERKLIEKKSSSSPQATWRRICRKIAIDGYIIQVDHGKLKKQVAEYDVIKRNIDSILQAEKQPERERQTERE